MQQLKEGERTENEEHLQLAKKNMCLGNPPAFAHQCGNTRLVVQQLGMAANFPRKLV
jgi:hypothetical protein